MGNQQGANGYQNYQPYGSQIGAQNFPYGNIPQAWAQQGWTPSMINNYYQQAYAPVKWPSATGIPAQPSQLPQPNFQGSYIHQLNSFKGSGVNQRGSQLNGTSAGLKYSTEFQVPQYVDQPNPPPSYLSSKGGNSNIFQNQQRTSNASQQQTPQTNLPQNQFYPSQIPQYQSQLPQQQQFPSQLKNNLPSNIPKASQLRTSQQSNIREQQINVSDIPMPQQRSQMIPPRTPQFIPPSQSLITPLEQFQPSEIHQPSTILTQPPSILQNKNQPLQSAMLRTNRSSSKQKKITFGDQVPRSAQLARANIKLAKDKFDKLANDTQLELYSIMQQIDSQINQGLPSKDRLLYLLSLKKNYEQTIIKIRMKQHRLAKIQSEIAAQPPPQVVEMIESSSKELVLFGEALTPAWREVLNAEGGNPDFARGVSQAMADPSVMHAYETYKAQVQAAFSKLPPDSATSSVMTIMKTTENPASPYNYGGYTGSSIKPTSSITSQDPNASVDQSKTARFGDPEMFPYSSNYNPQNSVNQSNVTNYALNVISPSEIKSTPIFPLSPPSSIPSDTIAPGESDASRFSTQSLKPVSPRPQMPKLADFLQSRISPPPPQFNAFTPPPLPTTNSFKI